MVERESGRRREGAGGRKSRAESMKRDAAWTRPEEPRAGWNTENRTDFSETQKSLCQVEETRPELVFFFFLPPSPSKVFNVETAQLIPPPPRTSSHVEK